MPQYKFSDRSLRNLIGVNMLLQTVMKMAILKSTIDFGIGEGVRSEERQQYLFDTGKSKTLKSKHITGDAVDVLVYKNGSIVWDHDAFAEVAEAVALVSKEINVPIRWGAAWTVPDIGKWEGTMIGARTSYEETRKGEGRTPFIDSPHFELP